MLYTTHRIKYYTAVKRSGLQLHASTWENLKGIMLNKKKTSCRGVLSVFISFKLNDDILLDIHNLEKTKGMINLKFRF